MPKSDVKSKPKVGAALGAYCDKTNLGPHGKKSVTTLIISNVMWPNHFPPVCPLIVYVNVIIKPILKFAV